MVWSGILIYWAHQPYFKIPEQLVEMIGIDHRLAEGMGWHFFIMWPFVLNGFIYLGWLLYSGEWRDLVPDRHTFPMAWQRFLFEVGVRKVPPPMKGKFNPLQGLSYFLVILSAAGSILTGLAIYKPVQLGRLASALGGYELARLEHFMLMISFVLFFLFHVIQVMRAGWNNFRSMVAGYEIEED